MFICTLFAIALLIIAVALIGFGWYWDKTKGHAEDYSGIGFEAFVIGIVVSAFDAILWLILAVPYVVEKFGGKFL